MAEILQFKMLRRPSGTRTGSVPMGPAEVVIFPGVRIERGDFSLADRLKRTARLRGIKRKTQKRDNGL